MWDLLGDFLGHITGGLVNIFFLNLQQTFKHDYTSPKFLLAFFIGFVLFVKFRFCKPHLNLLTSPEIIIN